MVYKHSKLLVADNTGAKKVLCIRLLNVALKKKAYAGELIRLLVKKCKHQKKVTKGVIHMGVILTTSGWVSRYDGFYINFDNNRVAIFSNTFKFLGSRIKGPVSKSLLLLQNNRDLNDNMRKNVFFKHRLLL
jgi:large subunit ribosomal protein L14